MPNSGITQIYGSQRLTEGALILGSRLATSNFAVEICYERVVVSSAEILALFTTPKTLVAAPGPGRLLNLLGAMIYLDATATAYAGVDAADDLTIRYTNAAGAAASNTLEATGFIDQTTDQIRTIKPIATDITPVANAPLVLHLSNSNITTGTGVLYVDILYAIHTTGL